jgi:predicted nucleic acid-binding protein
VRAARYPDDFSHWPAEILERLGRAYLAVTPFTVAEEKVGLLKSRWPEARRQAHEERLRRLMLIPLDYEIIDAYAQLRVECEKEGQTFGYHDLWIGATALSRAIALVSCDRRQCDIPHIEAIYLPPKATA